MDINRLKMDINRLNEIHTKLHDKEVILMNLKREGYATDEEVLKNFIDAARLLGTRPSVVAFSYFTKHMVSILKAVTEEQYQLNWEKIREDGSRDEGLIQRIADARNYLFFIIACLEHESDQVADFGEVKPNE